MGFIEKNKPIFCVFKHFGHFWSFLAIFSTKTETVVLGAPGKASMVPGGSPSPPSHPNHPTHPSPPTPAPFYLIDKSTGLYRAALLMSVLGASHRYFRLLMTPWWLIMHELYVVYLRDSSFQNAEKMEGKRKTPDQASSLMWKGGGRARSESL